jgi:hypothetical protein
LFRLLILSALTGAAFLLLAVPLSSGAPRPLITAITDDQSYSGPDAALAYERTRRAGARLVRLTIRWDLATPAGATKPPGFDPADPADPGYRFDELDREVRLAVAAGLQPVVGFWGAPLWAQDPSPHPTSYSGTVAGPYKPSPAEVGRFAHALAVRYSGSFHGLPRVRYWRLWNEPNLIGYLSPQFVNGKPFAPGWYRLMLKAFAGGVHSVHRDNVVVAGSLAPFSFRKAAMAPLQFMRSLLCLSAAKRPRPVCAERSVLDAFSIHPYTSGGPTHRASNPNDVSLGNAPEVRRILDVAVRYRHIVSTSRPQLWVTEFSWDTKPPDPNPLATPLRLQARWTAEALYRMWKAGVRVVTWFQLRDDLWPQSPFQSGLYFRSGVRMALDEPKPTLTAFRFPFVAYRQRGGVFVWGRAPAGRPARVVVEQRGRRTWKRIATIRSNRYGIFAAVLHRKLARPAAGPPPVVLAAYRSAVLADSPMSYWRLGENSGKTASDVRGRHPAAAVGGVRFGVPGALLNDRDTAVTLNGTDGRIDLGRIESPDTVELWIKTRTADDSPVFSNRNTLHQFSAVGVFERRAHIFDSFHLFGGRLVANNRWHQLVYTYSGITGKLYVDGRLEAENTWIRPPGGADASLGFDASLDRHFKGSIDEVSVYDHALSAARVRQHFLASGRKLGRDPDLGSLRARLIGSTDASLPFSLTVPRDRYVVPFGG